MSAIRERVEVIKLEGANFAWVIPTTSVGCGACGGCDRRCGQVMGRQSILSRAFNRDLRAFIIQLAPEELVKVGDVLTVRTDVSSMSVATLLGYLLPLISMLVGAVLMKSGGDSGVLVGLLLGFLVSILLQRLILRFPFEVLSLNVVAEPIQDERMR